MLEVQRPHQRVAMASAGGSHERRKSQLLQPKAGQLMQNLSKIHKSTTSVKQQQDTTAEAAASFDASSTNFTSTSKVPRVKSQLKQPVASSAWAQSSSSQSSSTSSSGNSSSSSPEESSPSSSIYSFAQQHSQNASRSAKSIPSGSTLARSRPTTLALKSSNTGTSKPSSAASKMNSHSILPKLMNTRPSNSKLNAQTYSSTVETRNSISTGRNSIGDSSVKSHSQVSAKRRYATSRVGGSTVEPSKSLTDSRLSGLKNLVAVVHPQYSQRVNSSAKITTTVNKPIQTIAKAPVAAVRNLVNTKATTAKNSSGKVNSAHKDVTACREKESKQDERQISLHRTARTTTATTTSTKATIASGNYRNLIRSRSKCAGSHFTSTTNSEGKSGQNEQQNDKAGMLFDATNKTSTNSDIYQDKKKYVNSKQSNKHLPERTTSTISQQQDDKLENGDGDDDYEEQARKNLLKYNTNGSDCYNHHDDVLKSTLTKSPAIYFKRDEKHATLNDRIRPKPMGQQVLSLMMLDVGLLPANNTNQCNLEDEQEQQHSLATKKSHVRLPSLIKPYNEVNSISNKSNSFFATGSHSALPMSSRYERAPALIMNQGATDYRQNAEQCNNYHSLIPNLETLKVQVHLPKRDNVNLNSVSLPSSPRRQLYGDYPNRRFEKNHATSNGHELFLRPDAFGCQSTTYSLGERENVQYSTKSPALHSKEHHGKCAFNNFRLLQSTYENQLDSHSQTSSSSSSLNHQCPPLLSLSNQLGSLKFEDLVKVNSTTKESCCSPRNSETCLQRNKFENTPSSADQVSQVEKQHENLFVNNSSPKLKESNSPSKLNPVKFSKRCVENDSDNWESLKQQPVSTYQQQKSQMQHEEVTQDIGSSLNSPTRRQQQPRSHSIGGHDYYSNGNYQRLKQSVLNQQNYYDSHQFYAHQGNHSPLLQTSSSNGFPPQQLPGRTPSPLGIDCQSEYDSSMRCFTPKYLNRQPPRNQLHASLECLNSGYTENQSQLRGQQTQYLQQQHPQQQIQNHHYAASYVLAPPPANTIINQNGEQDLAAAAMGAPPSQYQMMTNNNQQNLSSPQYSSHTQNLINRAMAQVSQSPLRRIGLTSNSNTGTSSSILNHITGTHHPIRAGHSSLSLTSSSFIIEDKLQNEIRKLQSELKSEKEKNDALNSQLNINSSLMGAFEQSLTTLNTRLRQLTALNENKDNEIDQLKAQLKSAQLSTENEKRSDSNCFDHPVESVEEDKHVISGDRKSSSEKDLNKIIEDLKRQLIEKDRLLTDTRLDALNAAHQLEQLESRLNGEHSLLVNEDELDEGVMVVNHSPTDSEAVTESTHLNEINDQISKNNHQQNIHDSLSFTLTSNRGNNNNYLNDNNNTKSNNNSTPINDSSDNTIDAHSNHSSDYLIETKSRDQQDLNGSISQQFDGSDSGVLGDLLDSLQLSR